MTKKKSDDDRGYELLAAVKPLAAEFYRLTGKPLGVTGEIAEYAAAQKLDLQLTLARNVGYDAIRGKTERIQIKGRAFDPGNKRAQRMSRIKLDAPCDTVMLVLLNNKTLEPLEIWEAPYDKVVLLLQETTSKARARGQLAVGTFKRYAKLAWPISLRNDVKAKGLF